MKMQKISILTAPIEKIAKYITLELHCNTLSGSKMADTTFTFRVDDVLKNEFSKAAKACDRSSAQLLRDYMRDIVKEQKEKSAYDLWFREQIQLGINSANAGDIISSEEIEKEAKEWRLKTQSKLDISTL